jgi:hypothetical protein
MVSCTAVRIIGGKLGNVASGLSDHADVNDVAVFDDVIFAFEQELAGFFEPEEKGSVCFSQPSSVSVIISGVTLFSNDLHAPESGSDLASRSRADPRR